MEVILFTILSRTHFLNFWFCCILCDSVEALIYKAINKPSEHWGVLSTILFFFCEFFCWIVMTTVSSWRHFILLPQTDYFYHLCLLIEAFKVTALDLCSTPSPTTKPGQRLGVWISYSFSWKLRKSEVILWSLMIFGVGLNCMKWSNWVIDSM